MRRQDKPPRTKQKAHGEAEPWWKDERWFLGPYRADIPDDVKWGWCVKLIRDTYSQRVAGLRFGGFTMFLGRFEEKNSPLGVEFKTPVRFTTEGEDT